VILEFINTEDILIDEERKEEEEKLKS